MKATRSTATGAALAVLLLTSCGQNKAPAKTTTAPSPQPAETAQSLDPASRYANGMINAQKRAQVLSQLPTIQQAVQMFYNQENRFPKSLDELIQEGFLSYLPLPPTGLRYTYNPQNGIVALIRK